METHLTDEIYIDKCYTMQVGRKRHTVLNTYTLHDHPLPITDIISKDRITIICSIPARNCLKESSLESGVFTK